MKWGKGDQDIGSACLATPHPTTLRKAMLRASHTTPSHATYQPHPQSATPGGSCMDEEDSIVQSHLEIGANGNRTQ